MVAWHKGIGEYIAEEDLLLDVATETLAEKGYDLKAWAGEVVMQIECHDEGFLACKFASATPRGQDAESSATHTGHSSSSEPSVDDLPCGVPLALLCEVHGDVARVQALQGDTRAVLEALGPSVRRDAAWQAYVRSADHSPPRGMCDSC